MDVRKPGRQSVTDGASLVSLLMLVVVLGGLTATAIVGVNSMTGSSNSVATLGTTGSNAGTSTSAAATTGNAIGAGLAAAAVAACNASAEAARAASSVFYANSGGSYPTKWSDLTTGNPPLFASATNVAVNAANPAELDGRGWKMMLTGGGTTATTITCSPRAATTP